MCARGVSPKVIGHLQRTEQNVDEYNRLRQARGGLKVAHGLIYIMISMTALLAAIWVGMWFAGRFVAPIRRLIAGAQEVSRGNLEIELPEKRGEGDLRRLSHTFNLMTRELKHQHDALVTANEQLTERRNFIEAVLSGVSAGVIGLDSPIASRLLSRSAEELLLGCRSPGRRQEACRRRAGSSPPVLSPSEETGLKTQRSALRSKCRSADEERTFAVRSRTSGPATATSAPSSRSTTCPNSFRPSARGRGRDVARRIAHEIKNPLTPIHLSAERLRKKFGKQITENRETFETLTQTIERQTGEIKSMVDEFASFARMPQPVMEIGDLRVAVQEPVDPVPRGPYGCRLRAAASREAGRALVRSAPASRRP